MKNIKIRIVERDGVYKAQAKKSRFGKWFDLCRAGKTPIELETAYFKNFNAAYISAVKWRDAMGEKKTKWRVVAKQDLPKTDNIYQLKKRGAR